RGVREQGRARRGVRRGVGPLCEGGARGVDGFGCVGRAYPRPHRCFGRAGDYGDMDFRRRVVHCGNGAGCSGGCDVKNWQEVAAALASLWSRLRGASVVAQGDTVIAEWSAALPENEKAIRILRGRIGPQWVAM